MRLRAVYLLAAAASVVAVLMVAAPANATANWSCTETFTSSPAPLDNNLDCSGTAADALNIGADGVVLNFNGFTVTVNSGDYDGVDTGGYNGATIENGTINIGTGGTATEGYGVDNDGGNGLTVANMTINGGYYGVDNYGNAVGLNVNGSTIAGQTDGGVYTNGGGASITDNSIAPASGGAGLDAYDGLGDVISGNTLTGNFDGTDEISDEYGIHLHKDTAALVSNNTVSAFGELGYYESWSSGTQLTGNVFDGNYEGAEIGDGDDGFASNDAISNNFFRNSYYEGIQDYGSDMNTYTGNVATNNGIECGTSPSDSCSGFYIDNDVSDNGVGSVTMTNNYSRLNSYGYYVYYAYNGDSFASTRSLFSGNSATYNDYGFSDYYSVLSTWSNNTAYGNNDDGFDFDYPDHETITNNTSTHNGYTGNGEGFYFEDNYAPYEPLTVANNSATYNGDYGFYADYPLSTSSGNTGNSTNGTDDCWYVSGCS